MTKDADPLIAIYKSQRREYDAFTDNLCGVIKDLTRDREKSIVTIVSRTKDVDSLYEKLERKDHKYTSIDEITDLSGIRIITYLQDEVEKICDIIRENFVIDVKNSADKAELLNTDQFGYRSMHFVVCYHEDWLKVPQFKRFAGKKAEVQVRTVLQHAWAQIDWKLRYKPEPGELSKDIQRRLFLRRLYRLSAALETADDEFTNVTILDLDLRKRYEENIQKGDLDIEVNQESLELFIDKSDTVGNLKSFAEKAKFHISPPNPRTRFPWEKLSITLHEAGITHISALKEYLKAAKDRAPYFLEKLYKQWDKNTSEKPNRPKMLGIDLGSLIRLLIIEGASKEVAQQVLKKCPFGPELNRAVQTMVSEKKNV